MKNWFAKNISFKKTEVRSNQCEMEKLLYLQNIRSRGAISDEVDIELEK